MGRAGVIVERPTPFCWAACGAPCLALVGGDARRRMPGQAAAVVAAPEGSARRRLPSLRARHVASIAVKSRDVRTRRSEDSKLRAKRLRCAKARSGRESMAPLPKIPLCVCVLTTGWTRCPFRWHAQSCVGAVASRWSTPIRRRAPSAWPQSSSFGCPAAAAATSRSSSTWSSLPKSRTAASPKLATPARRPLWRTRRRRLPMKLIADSLPQSVSERGRAPRIGRVGGRTSPPEGGVGPRPPHMSRDRPVLDSRWPHRLRWIDLGLPLGLIGISLVELRRTDVGRAYVGSAAAVRS